MKQGRNHLSAGFTIVEVLVVLAAMSLLFVIAASFVNGQQNRAEFINAIQQTQSEIQKTANDVINGHYPNANNITCSINSQGAPSVTQVPPGTGTPMGTSSKCIFIGNALQFNPSGSFYNIYTIFGDRTVFGSNPSVNSADLGSSNAAVTTSAFGDYETQQLNNGLTVANVCYLDPPTLTTCTSTNSVGAFAFSNDFHAFAIGGVHSGIHNIKLYALEGISFGQSLYNNEPLIGVTFANAMIVPEIQICFNSGTTQRSGLLTINSGTNAGSSVYPNVTLAIMDGLNC